MSINSIEEAEPFLKKSIFSDLEHGRPNWDKPHTEAVIFYVKEVVQNTPELDLDRDVLIVVAYAHDWGYADLFKNGLYIGREEIQKVKTVHSQISEKKITNLLQNSAFSFLKPEQKKRIAHLVLLHDNLEDLRRPDELVFMEADTLGQLDINFVRPTLNKADNEKYMKGTAEKRISRFITPFAKSKASELFKLREEYYKKL